jgi:hypothetical protein
VNGGTVDANGFSIPLSTPLADDGHQVEVSLANQAGTSGQTSWVFALDANTWLTDLSPADGAILNRDSITVSGRAEVGNVVTLTVDSSFVATTTVSATNDFTLTEVAVTDGPHTLTALTADDLGNPAQASSEITVCAVQRNFRIESGVLGVFTGLQLRKIQCNFRKSPLFQRNFRKNPSLIILCIS